MKTTPEINVEESVRSIAGASVLAHALIDILRRESRALATATFEVPAEFIDAKCRLVALYTNKVEMVQSIPALPETNSAQEELRMLNAELMTLARHNAMQIQGAIDGRRLLLAIMADKGARPAYQPSPNLNCL